MVTPATIGALSVSFILLLLLLVVFYKCRQVSLVQTGEDRSQCPLGGRSLQRNRNQRRPFTIFSSSNRNQSMKSCGKLSRVTMGTTTPLLTPPSCRTTRSGSFLEKNCDSVGFLITPETSMIYNTDLPPQFSRSAVLQVLDAAEVMNC